MIIGFRAARRNFSVDAIQSSKSTIMGRTLPSVPSSFYPKVSLDVRQTVGRKSSRIRPILMFTLANAIPLFGIAYYLKWSIDERQKELKRFWEIQTLPVNDALRLIDSMIRSCSNSVMLVDDQISPVLPHQPESSDLVLSSDELVDNIEKTLPGTSAVFDSISASRNTSESVPVNFVHVGISSKSVVMERISTRSDRKVTIIYNGGPLGDVTVTLRGVATIVEDERLRKLYWRDIWGQCMGRENYVLLKVLPCEVVVSSVSSGETLANGIKIMRYGNSWNR